MTTTAQVLSTPVIDSILVAGSYRQIARYNNAIVAIGQALEAQSVYNQELEAYKTSIKYGVEEAARQLVDAVRDATTPDARYQDWFWDVDYGFNLNHAAGKVKRLQRSADHIIATVPAMARYLQLLAEVAEVNDVMVALKPFVIKGRKPLENPKPVDMSNTAVCAICGGTQKMTAGKKMVHHGFQISDGYGHYIGFRSGSCFGVGYKPRELSNDANKAFKKALETALVKGEGTLEVLKSGNVATLNRPVQKKVNGVYVKSFEIVNLGDQEFPRTLAIAIADAEGEIHHINSGIAQQELAIKTWERKPLYDELHAK